VASLPTAWLRLRALLTHGRRLDQFNMANAQSLCEFIYRNDCRVTASILKAAHILLTKSRNVAEFLLGQTLFESDPPHVLPHQSAHIHAQKEEDYKI
jgi:hypothetical protein